MNGGTLIKAFFKELKEPETVPVDMGKLAHLQKSGMSFELSAFDAGALRVSTISMKAMLGLMSMESVIVTSREKDVPLFNLDLVRAASKRTFLAEFYDTMLEEPGSAVLEDAAKVRALYEALPEYVRGERWYDSMLLPCSLGKSAKKDLLSEEKMTEIASSYSALYMRWLESSPACSPEDKKEKTLAYVSRLLSEGGASTDQFRKLFGAEVTEKIFMTLFGLE